MRATYRLCFLLAFASSCRASSSDKPKVGDGDAGRRPTPSPGDAGGNTAANGLSSGIALPVSGTLWYRDGLIITGIADSVNARTLAPTTNPAVYDRFPKSADVGVSAVRAATGEQLWTVRNVPLPSAVTNDRIFAYSRNGALVALRFDGTEAWRLAVADDRSTWSVAEDRCCHSSAGDVVVLGETLYVPAGAEVLAVNSNSGAVKARTVACKNGSTFVERLGHGGSHLVAVCASRSDYDKAQAPDEQHRKWEGGDGPTAAELRPQGRVLMAFDSGLKPLWSKNCPDDWWCGGAVPVSTGTDSFVLAMRARDSGGSIAAWGARLVAMDARDGHQLWQAESRVVPQQDPTIVGPLIWWGRAIDATTGEAAPVNVPEVLPVAGTSDAIVFPGRREASVMVDGRVRSIAWPTTGRVEVVTTPVATPHGICMGISQHEERKLKCWL